VVNAPSVYWCIDVHRMDTLMGGGTRWDKLRGFDLVCSAQRDMAEQLSVPWLPLACDPTMSHPIDTPKLFTWSFVGSMVTDKRQSLLDHLRKTVPGGVVATAYGAAMNALYAASQLVVNVSYSNDINMRFFEAIASGTPLLSTRPRNGEDELFDTVLWFDGERDIAAVAEGALAAPEQLHQLGLAGAQQALARHSYQARMGELLELVGARSFVPIGVVTPARPG
jgi:spore maturation protein CgeB